MIKVKSICVYGASSGKVDKVYMEAASALGEILAQNHVKLINGAGKQGLMGASAEACMNAGGEVIGVIPQFMVEQNWGHKHLSQYVITKNMHERKEKMAELADACIALPGGCGTMEELLEVITWKQLGLYPNPIIILNTNNYYGPLLEMLQKAADEHFMRDVHTHIWKVTTDVNEILNIMEKEPLWDESVRKFSEV